MATIGTLRAVLALDPKQFNRETKRAQGSIARLRRSFGGAARSLAGFQGGFAAVAGATGIGLLVKNSLDAADSLDKTSDKLGIGVEALQEYRFAAQLAGVAQNTFDMGLQRFTRRVAEAASGTGEAKAALRELGIGLTDSDGKIRTTEALLSDVADAFTRVESPADRVRLAFKLFDSEGVALLNVLQDGSAALEATRQRARDLGIVMGADLVQQAVRAKDELTIVGNVISANVNVALAEMAPLIVQAVGAFAQMATAARESWEDLRAFAVGTQELPVTAQIRILGEELERLERLTAAASSSRFPQRRRRAQGVLLSEGLGIDEALAKIETLKGKIEELKGRRDSGRPRLPTGAGAAAPVELAADTDLADKAFELRQRALEAEGQFVQAARERLRVEAQVVELTTLDADQREEMLGSLEKIRKAELKAAQARQDAHDRAKAGFDAMTAASESFRQVTSSAFRELVNEGRLEFRKLGLAFVEEFANRAINEGISAVFAALKDEKARSEFFGAGKGILGSLGIPGFAEGGLVRGPTLAMVGEKGPEAILPLDKLKGLRGGDVVVNVYANEPVETRESRTPDGRRMLEIMVGDVFTRQLRSGGPIARSIEGHYGLSRTGLRKG